MKNLVKSAIRILSIYFLAKSLQTIPLFITSNIDLVHKNLMRLYYSSTLGLTILIGIILWVFAEIIAKKVVGNENDDISFNAPNLQIVAFSVVGLVILVNAIPNIVTDLFKFLPQNLNKMWLYQYIIEIVLNVIKLILGLWLLIGSKGIVEFINRKGNADKIEDKDIHIED